MIDPIHLYPPVEPGTTGVAIFDLDNTLITTDCEMMWTKFLYAEGWVDGAFVSSIEGFFRDYDLGKLDINAYEEFMAQPLIGRPFTRLYALRDRFIQQIFPLIRKNMIERLAWHQGQHHTLVLATASNNLITEKVAERLGIPNLICTRFDLSGGAFSGKLLDVPAYYEGKAQLLHHWIDQNQVSLDCSWGYSDSFHDLPFLNLVTYPVAVYPDDHLRAHALDHHWEIIAGS